jgi:hypothetical protein
MKTFRFVPATTVLLFGAAMAFNVGSKTNITPKKATSPITESSGTSLFYVSEKPTFPQIEEAALKEASSSLIANNKPSPSKQDWQPCGSVQGTPSKTPGECCRYAFELTESKPALQAKLQQLTEKRPYPLFLLEKAAKVIGNVLPKSSISTTTKTKEKVVILGSGWASAAFLQDINTDQFDVTVVSPRNYFLFTPLLASSSVGTVDIRSITRPIREVCYYYYYYYYYYSYFVSIGKCAVFWTSSHLVTTVTTIFLSFSTVQSPRQLPRSCGFVY